MTPDPWRPKRLLGRVARLCGPDQDESVRERVTAGRNRFRLLRSYQREFLAQQGHDHEPGGWVSVPEPSRQQVTSSSRVVVHDYSGHPGQAQLSRALAARGYEVVHQHCPSYSTGKGSLEVVAGDPPTLRFEECPMNGTFARYSAVTRIRQELAYGRDVARRIIALEPAIVVLSNVPLLAHSVLARRLARHKIPMVFWHQDIYSEAIGSAARSRIPVLGSVVARLADRVERTIARRSEHIVAISPTFLDRLAEWGVAWKSSVVPNWAPIDELPLRPPDNPWSKRLGLVGHPVVLYSGTLGLKHDPSILALMADQLRVSHPSARVVVVSEGKGRDWLEAYRTERGADNLVLLDYQPYADLPDVMASADVLVAILEPDASRFSVPSKVLSYLCANRAIVGVMPERNAVAEVLTTHGAGIVIDPTARDDIGGLVARLLNEEDLCRAMGRAGRAYAERTFDPERAADVFVTVFGDHVAVPDAPTPQSASPRPRLHLAPGMQEAI
jgi:glycosyltransferase involved in cell wall biosynthesis